MKPVSRSLDDLGLATSDALAVVAHPDDESFGLGAVLAGLTARGTRVRVLCFTHGEASTLGTNVELGAVRRRELERAGRELRVEEVCLLDYADGRLAEVPESQLAGEVEKALGPADLLVVFEAGGVTGHPDHRAATAAARRVAERHGLPLLEWGVPARVATVLNEEFAAHFTAAAGTDVRVDRSTQWRAIWCHASQAHDNPVLRRRLELLGNRERLRLDPAK